VPLFGSYYTEPDQPLYAGVTYGPNALLDAMSNYSGTGSFTMFFAPLDSNMYYNDWMTLGSVTQWSFTMNMLMALVLVCVASTKLSAQIAQFGVQARIPQFCLLFCLCSGMIGLVLAVGGAYAWHGVYHHRICKFVILLCPPILTIAPKGTFSGLHSCAARVFSLTDTFRPAVSGQRDSLLLRRC
jgi:hypothetical protein